MANEKKKVIKIDPQLDATGARKLQNDVKKTFKAGSSQLESGLTKGIAKIGAAFLGAFAFEKIIAGFQEVAASATETTKSVTKWADDLSTNAKLFETTPKQLARLLTTGGGAGLSDDQVYNAINRVNDYLTTQRELGNPYAQKYSDNPVEAFIQYVNAIKNEKDVSKRNASINEVFGKRQALTYADFLLSDWDALSNIRFTNDFNDELERVAGLNDMADRMRSDARYADIWRNMGITDENKINEIQKTFQQELDQAFEKNRAAANGGYTVSRGMSEFWHVLNPAIMGQRMADANLRAVQNIEQNSPDWVKERMRQRGAIPVTIVNDKNQSYANSKAARQNAKGVNE